MINKAQHEIKEHWLGEDGRTNLLEFHGDMLQWKVLQPNSKVPIGGRRGKVTSFSRASRLRVFKYFAGIRWDSCLPASFLTLTYPDEACDKRTSKLTQNRSVFWRYLEGIVGRQVASFWRIEWKPRLSGANKGSLFPHWHFLIANVPFIDKWTIKEVWAKTLAYADVPVTDIKAVKNVKSACRYVSKYIAKVSSCVLDEYCISQQPTGRHWGFHRKECLPWHEKITLRIAQDITAAVARTTAIEGTKLAEQPPDGSFTVFGDTVAKVLGFLESFAIDKDCEMTYN